MPMVGNGAIRATGDTLTPSLLMVGAGLTNAILDPFLIFGLGPFPRLELQGAALATIFSYALAFLASIWVLARRKRMLSAEAFAGGNLLALPGGPSSMWGLPAVAANQLLPLATGALTRILSGFGEVAVAAYGVAGRLEALALAPCFALSTTMAPVRGPELRGRTVRPHAARPALRLAVQPGGGPPRRGLSWACSRSPWP
jgi:Na+-driven multidrug efflux pump